MILQRCGRSCMTGPRLHEQLELKLEGIDAPWEGRSPRVLTKAYLRFSFQAPPPGGPIQGATGQAF